MDTLPLILVEKDLDESPPNYTVEPSDFLCSRLPPTFASSTIRYYRAWNFKEHYILLEQENGRPGPPILGGIFGLVHNPDEADNLLFDRAKGYAGRLKQIILLSHGLEVKIALRSKKKGEADLIEQL
jgi:hypothetical protein